MKPVLVAGAGFAGAVIARELADNGIPVHVIERREHIGGNAHDYINLHGERVHRYGPHLLHGDKDSIAIKWLSRFTKWIPYEHRVRALLPNNKTTPLPVNQTTLRDVYGFHVDSEEKAEALLNKVRVHINGSPKNTDEFFLANVGEELANLFFRPYTQKMWGIAPCKLMPAIGARLPVRTNLDDRYFTDTFQALPAEGYTTMFERILNHKLITIDLNTEFSKDMEASYQHCFLSVPIDMYFEYRHGQLPYRSIIFHEKRCRETQPAPVINFTDLGRFTRKTQWDLLPNSMRSEDGLHTVTLEEPCAMDRNPGEYYYPVQNLQSLSGLEKYKEDAKEIKRVTFCGRTGLFRYIDMVPAVNIHLNMVKEHLRKFQGYERTGP